MKSHLYAVFVAVPLLIPGAGAAELFVVTSSGDSNHGSLREAVAAANTTTGQDIISISVSAPITLSSDIGVHDPVVIEGHGATLSGYGLVLAIGSSQSAISDMAITNCGGDAGIKIISDRNTVRNCTFTSNANGVLIMGSGNTVGGNSTWGEGNRLSGNGIGVAIAGGSRNCILGNIIGFSADQLSAWPNAYCGIFLDAADQNCIGKSGAGWGNVIGNNGVGWPYPGGGRDYPAGVTLLHSHQNILQNNYIGLNTPGDPAPNAQGICVIGSDGNVIGGYRNDSFLERNIISGNADAGIKLDITTGNVIAGNYIGLDGSGARAVPNQTGISSHEGGNFIGGANIDSEHLRGNVISGNSLCGISVECWEGHIVGNLIGVNAAGNSAVGNGDGLKTHVWHDTTIGGTDPSLRNVISGNTQHGIFASYFGGLTHYIQGNFIGLNESGTGVIGNGISGMFLNDPLYQVGGNGGGEGNVICGESVGIQLSYGAASVSHGTTLTGNWIGVLADRTIAPRHLAQGVVLDQGTKHVYLGLAGTSGGNLIAGCEVGVRIDGPATVQNRILSNTICAFDSEGIELVNGGNQNNSAPVIDGATSGTVSGSGEAGCAIELFRAEPRIGRGGSLKFAGAGMADGAGHWSITPVGLNAGDFLCALATDSLNNTSGFSNNFIVGFVSTATSSPTQTPTLTPSPVWTPTPTGTLPPACTATSTGTPFPTASPTASVTDSRTPGPGYTGDGVKAFPNPAHDSMTFVLKLERADEVTVTIYNLSGERIADLKTSNGPGTARLVWDCSRTAPGVYLACVKVGGTEKIKLKVARVK